VIAVVGFYWSWVAFTGTDPLRVSGGYWTEDKMKSFFKEDFPKKTGLILNDVRLTRNNPDAFIGRAILERKGLTEIVVAVDSGTDRFYWYCVYLEDALQRLEKSSPPEPIYEVDGMLFEIKSFSAWRLFHSVERETAADWIRHAEPVSGPKPRNLEVGKSTACHLQLPGIREVEDWNRKTWVITRVK
jgi:hypothetical protein